MERGEKETYYGCFQFRHGSERVDNVGGSEGEVKELSDAIELGVEVEFVGGFDVGIPEGFGFGD